MKNKIIQKFHESIAMAIQLKLDISISYKNDRLILNIDNKLFDILYPIEELKRGFDIVELNKMIQVADYVLSRK